MISFSELTDRTTDSVKEINISRSWINYKPFKEDILLETMLTLQIAFSSLLLQYTT
jgi:hypothetical protein